jgi:hypothetical protein
MMATGFTRVVQSYELMEDLAKTNLAQCDGGLPRDHLGVKVACELLRVFSKLGRHEVVLRLFDDTIAAS